MGDAKKQVKDILSLANIKVNGKNPGDPIINNENFYSRVLSGGTLALGESFIDGWWDCKQLDIFSYKAMTASLNTKINKGKFIFAVAKAKLLNLQTKSHSKKVAEEHYDLGNEFYEKMLDKRLVYTCWYWKNAENLDQAQENKLDLICKKLHLKKGMKVLDIGCGWWSFAKFAAENYWVKVVWITISKEQAKWAKEKCRGLPIEIRIQDYRDVNEKFDAIVSIGMFEHVGVKN